MFNRLPEGSVAAYIVVVLTVCQRTVRPARWPKRGITSSSLLTVKEQLPKRCCSKLAVKEGDFSTGFLGITPEEGLSRGLQGGSLLFTWGALAHLVYNL